MPSRWTRFLAGIDPLARVFGAYTAYGIREQEHVGTVWFPAGINDTRRLLVSNGYEPQWLSAAKRHPDTGQLHDLSMRRVPELHPFAVTGTALDGYSPGECQYHVHAFDMDETVALFSHYELRPDFFSPSLSLGRLRMHYRPVYGETYLRGVTDLSV